MVEKKEVYMWPSNWKKPVSEGNNGGVSTNNYYATKAGLEILKKGGNAFDAAVAVSLVLSVVEPHHSGIGGGAFTLMYNSEEKKAYALDGRGIAPKKAKKDLFIRNGKVVDEWKDIGGKSVAIPGLLKNLEIMHNKFGTLELKELIKPSINYAFNGFSTSFTESITINDPSVKRKIKEFSDFKKLFLKENETKYDFGERKKNLDLAKLLTKLSEDGLSSFYKGEIAEKIVNAINNHDGCYEIEDLENYDSKFREVIYTNYRNHKILTFPPPASGTALIEMLNILENFDLNGMGSNSSDYLHALAETMKIVFADRSISIADPDFVRVNTEKLISKDFAKQRYNLISNKSQEYLPDDGILPEEYPGNTSHFSIIDKYGNAVSQTQTIRDWYGSGIVVDGLGFVLNNNMSDFSASEGELTSQGLSYGSANSIEGGKTPLSSMCPTFVLKDDEVFLSIGSAGGPRIITGTLQGIVNAIDFNMNSENLVNIPYITSLSKNQGLEIESGISSDTINILKEKGHSINVIETGNVMSTMVNNVMKKNDKFYAASTKRVDGCGGTLYNDTMIFEGFHQE
ncbi:gamma-glutamyltransferase [Peptoniphilus sp. MSJ-1]|uniref:Glutathione hydrolase proenzyme n=1 Tax=Peptoniphilus ovalis TaxID=2841503 RepID=A0ABS6FF78_9FIRM|nr:gamma-glutamyltransferase [Peptoniphilus ovalis]MBU5668629.1 gamma-glutamyltransferase [Peptoniphilus ovalis]